MRYCLKLFIASYFHRLDVDSVSGVSVSVIANCLLRLVALLELVDIGFSSSVFKSFLFGEIVQMANAEISVAGIEEDFNKHIADKWKPADIKIAIKDYYKHTLVYLNEYLFALETGKPFSLSAKYDIEHIMPMNGANLSTIKRDAQIESEDEFKSYVNLLWNKILLENILRLCAREPLFNAMVYV